MDKKTSKVYLTKTLKYYDKKRLSVFCDENDLQFKYEKSHYIIIDNHNRKDIKDLVIAFVGDKVRITSRDSIKNAKKDLSAKIFNVIDNENYHKKDEILEIIDSDIKTIEQRWDFKFTETILDEVYQSSTDSIRGYQPMYLAK